MTSDNIYREPQSSPAPFEFNARVAEVFPDMIARSVPGYAATLRLIGSIADRYVRPGGRVYDLGCSLGAASRSVHRTIGDRAPITAVDTSEAMITRLQQELCSDGITSITPLLEDIRDIEVNDADLTLLNFTLQFIPPDDRLPLLSSIASGTRSGGVLVLSEKITFEDPRVETEMIALHEAFKRENGYGDLEIAQKRKALEDVLIPETLSTHQTRLADAGFSTSTVWLQCFNFASLIAVK
jgi:tRNA (cmo5U34)-methyltransferase